MDTITRKSLLYKSGVEYADYSLNHVIGCSHGCRYPCYAFMMKKRCGVIKTYQEWCNPKIVSNAIDLLEKEIPRHRQKIKYVYLCFSTDPFMYQQEDVVNLSLNIITKLNSSGIPCIVLTKGILPPQIGTNGFFKNNEYGITLVSLNENFKNHFEPNAATYNDRIEALEYLHKKGLKTWVSIEPYPPPNLIEQDLDEILERIKFVDKIVFGRLNYNKVVSENKNNTEFYNTQSIKVIKFCKQNGIAVHIKKGTQTSIKIN